MQIFTTVNDMLGPIGLIAVLGILGLMMVATTVIMMLRQPEDPLAKLKRNQSDANVGANQQRLRQSDRNEQLQKFAKFLEPENVEELSAKALMLRQAGYPNDTWHRGSGYWRRLRQLSGWR